jgi:hypothetical protein
MPSATANHFISRGRLAEPPPKHYPRNSAATLLELHGEGVAAGVAHFAQLGFDAQ